MGIKVIICDDHDLFRIGLQMVLNQISNIELIHEATDGLDFLDKIDNNIYDIAFMDISMPKLNGIEATRIAIQKYPLLKIIAISMYGDEEYYSQMVQAGVKGFLLKNSTKAELENAVNEIINGRNYFSQELLRNIIVNMSPSKHKNYILPQDSVKLTEREKDILTLICNGFSNTEIAEKLFISPKTVDNHRTKLLQKTGAKNAANLVMFAIKNNLVNL